VKGGDVVAGVGVDGVDGVDRVNRVEGDRRLLTRSSFFVCTAARVERFTSGLRAHGISIRPIVILYYQSAGALETPTSNV
jgi:hypothetical protein